MKKNTFIPIILALILAILPESALAAAVRLESTRSVLSVGDTAVLTLKVDTGGVAINAIDGTLTLESAENALTVAEFSLANSAFQLWPRTPSLESESAVISFVGGVQGGFTGEGAAVFKIIVHATHEGSATVTPQDVSVFANNGSGTRIPSPGQSLVIKVGPETKAPVVNDWKATVASDTTPPEDFNIVVGADHSVFEGKTFAFFSAVDNQSGISYYEVSEDGGLAVRSGSTYVLQNQSGTAKLEVTAFDKAGNKKSSTYPNETLSEPTGATSAEASPKDVAWPSIIVVILLIIIGTSVYKKFKK
jgi:hypothetical protein